MFDLEILKSCPAESVTPTSSGLRVMKAASTRSPSINVITTREPRCRTATLSQLPGVSTTRWTLLGDWSDTGDCRPPDAQPALNNPAQIAAKIDVRAVIAANWSAPASAHRFCSLHRFDGITSGFSGAGGVLPCRRPLQIVVMLVFPGTSSSWLAKGPDAHPHVVRRGETRWPRAWLFPLPSECRRLKRTRADRANMRSIRWQLFQR